jgi:hypothetical protein
MGLYTYAKWFFECENIYTHTYIYMHIFFWLYDLIFSLDLVCDFAIYVMQVCLTFIPYLELHI